MVERAGRYHVNHWIAIGIDAVEPSPWKCARQKYRIQRIQESRQHLLAIRIATREPHRRRLDPFGVGPRAMVALVKRGIEGHLVETEAIGTNSLLARRSPQ